MGFQGQNAVAFPFIANANSFRAIFSSACSILQWISFKGVFSSGGLTNRLLFLPQLRI